MDQSETLPAQGALYFEDYVVGRRIGSPGRTITEHDVMAFAGLSGDFNPLHTDAEYARSTPFGQRIAHGILGLSVATGLAARAGFMEGTVLAFTGLDWKFKKAVLFGDTVRTEVDVSDLRAMPGMGGGFVTLAVRLLNQRDEVVQRGTWTVLVRSRASAAGDAVR